MKKTKIITIVVILLLALIVFLQNTQAVETRFLFLTVTMPRVLLLLVTFVLGFVGGLITASYVLRKPAKSEEND
jgi:putative membrane protein